MGPEPGGRKCLCPLHHPRPALQLMKPLLPRCRLPNTDSPLPIPCPKCKHEQSTLVVKGITVITVTCLNCGHTWATRLDWLSAEIQEKVRTLLSS